MIAKDQDELKPPRYFRSLSSGVVISEGARISAARARIKADRKRGVKTPQWIIDIAQESSR